MRRFGTYVLLVLALAAVAFGTLYATGHIPYRVYPIHTESMEPTFPLGTAAIVRMGEYHEGAAVTYVVHGETITHRLQAVNHDGTITTQGDANATPDPWHPAPSAIVGGVVASPRYLGYAWYYLFMTPTGFASLALLILTLWQARALLKELLPDSPPARHALVAKTT